MKIEDSPAYCPICFKLCANDLEVEECIRSHNKVNEAERQENFCN